MSWHDSQLILIHADSSRICLFNKSHIVDCKDGLSLCIIVRETIDKGSIVTCHTKDGNRRKKCELASAWVLLRYANWSQWNNATWSQRQRSALVSSRMGRTFIQRCADLGLRCWCGWGWRPRVGRGSIAKDSTLSTLMLRSRIWERFCSTSVPNTSCML